MVRGLKFRIEKEEGLIYLCRENKDADQFVVTAKLLCVFVFPYTKIQFSHNAAHMIMYTPDYTPPRVHVCWFEHADLSFGNGFMTLNYVIGALTTNLY